jgi:hypothetical protein
MLPILLAADPDPTALIIAAGASALSVLLGIVLALVNARAGHVETTVKEQGHQINTLFIDKTRIEGDVKTLRAEVDALKKDTLTKEIFERETKNQNEKLDKVDRKVGDIDRGLRSNRSSDHHQAVRPIPRTDGPSVR